MSDLDRPRLRSVLRLHYRWIDDEAYGPRTVDAGECDRCRRQPRLVPTCGPTAWTALCRGCALHVGEEAWCAGHAEEGRAVLDGLGSLPDEWDTVVLLWWVATGEVRLDQLVDARTERVPAAVRAALPDGR